MSGIELYIGDLIEHESDRAVLKYVVDTLSRKNLSAIVLANVNFCNRQIDLIVGINSLVVVIEAKSFSCPFRGSDNGDWEILSATGWKVCDNYYLQTVKAVYAVRDTIKKFKTIDEFYPKGALVFSPSIPTGSSDFRGNFKARIIGINELYKLLEPTNQAFSWTIDTWREFAKHHNLRLIPDMKMAMDAKLLEADRITNAYSMVFDRYYSNFTINFILNETISKVLNEVKLRYADNKNILLVGPSGCGKTLLAYQIALELIQDGHIPIVIQGKDFDGNLGKLINKEVALLQISSAEILFSASQRMNKRLVFLLDGYNECLKTQQKDLIRALSAACDRYEASVILTSQKQIHCEGILELESLAVSPPDNELKILIAKQASKGTLLHSQLTLLNSIESGLEAKLVGEIGLNIRPGMSRYAIFDTYIRKRLEENATEGIRALSIIAKKLSEDVSFCLSIRGLERIAEQENISTAILQHLRNVNLLIQDDDFINFGHELYLNAFSAEAIIRSSSNADDILLALKLPLNEDRKHLILGAIDDIALLIQVLSQISDETIIQACLLGQCGEFPYEWADTYSSKIVKDINAEIEQVRFNFDDTTWTKVKVIPESLKSWTLQELAFINALPYVFVKGKFFDMLLEAIKKMDNRNALECERLETQANKRLIGLRSGMFAFCYCGFGGNAGPAISSICRHLDNGLIYRSGSKHIYENVAIRLDDDKLSVGQLYVLLSLYRHGGGVDVPSIARLLPGILRNYWRGAGYHLRLCLMEAVQSSCWKISDTARKSLVEFIEELPDSKNIGISMAITDALKSLGALQESENSHIEDVKTMIRDVLTNQEDSNYRALAFNVWANQIDHPYEGAYCEAWSELSPDEQKTLLFMAAQTANHDSFFISLLITQLAAFNDPTVVSPILRWAVPPMVQSSIPQQDVSNFVIANIAVARLGCDLIDGHLDDKSNSIQAMIVVGKIFYWINRIDLSMDKRMMECNKLINILQHNKYAASVIYEVNRANCCFEYHVQNLPGSESILPSLWVYFSKELAEICRQALQDSEKQKSYFGFLIIEDMIEFLLDSLGMWGTTLDIQILRRWTSHPKFGKHALKSIKNLENVNKKSSI